MTKRFTGWHMATILIAFFGVVIAVNVIMATHAVSTFGGVVVENSYVASQEYNDWLAEARAEKALGWEANSTVRPDGRVIVAVSGPPEGATLTGSARHPLGRKPDTALTFSPVGEGRYLSNEALGSGRWTLRLQVTSNGQKWRQEEKLR